MLERKFLLESIHGIFPDLENTTITLNSLRVTAFTEKLLLPFLVYQNTIDLNHRLISLFLPENYRTSNLVPFYIILSQYRKALRNVMQTNNFENQVYRSNDKKVIFNSDICYISSVDFINRLLILKNGRGVETSVPFQNSYRIKDYGKRHDVMDHVDSFDRIDEADHGNIFTFPIDPRNDQYQGVIIFTNTTRFESLLRNVKISGSDLKDHLNIEKVVFDSENGEIKFCRISKASTSKKPVSVLLVRHDAYKAFENIMIASKGRLDHIKTIIIDEFDEMLSRWIESDRDLEELEWLKHNYIQNLNEKRIKDVYLICKNSRITIDNELKKYGITYYPWLITPIEAISLEEHETPLSPNMIVTNIGDSNFEILNQQLFEIILRWRDLAKTNFCAGEILQPIKCLYELKTKLNSFFNPFKIKTFNDVVLKGLCQLKGRWFSGGQDYGLIEQTKKFLTENFLDKDIKNFKIDAIKEFLQLRKEIGAIEVVSENTDEWDINWLIEIIVKQFPKFTVNHLSKNDFFQAKQNNKPSSKYIFYLTAEPKIVGNALGNLIADVQVFILDRRGYSFAESFSKSYQIKQKELGALQRKYELLNLKGENFSDQIESGILTINYNKKNVDTFTAQAPDKNEPNLNEVVTEIFEKQYGAKHQTTLDKYVILYDDGTMAEFPESRRVFLYEEDKDGDDFDKIFLAVSDLKARDQIIIAKKDIQVKDLLENALNRNKDFSITIEIDKQWRSLIQKHMKRCGMDIADIRRKLRQNKFMITEQSIRNWIEGDTRRPNNFPQLLEILSTIGVIQKGNIALYNKHNYDLKLIQINFVRTAIRKLLARLNGIIEERDDVFTESMLNEFIDHVDIKRVTSIYKL